MLDVAAYFERIGMPRDTAVERTVGFLREVVYRHVLTVPYENLDILEGKPLSLTPEALFDKIVTRRRGGFCFELNALLSYFLKQLGFEVTDCFARFLRGESEIPMRRHHVLIVTCEDGRYLCDVGVGQRAPRYPVRLELDTVQEQSGEYYLFSRDPFLGWVLCELRDGERKPVFSFTEEAQLMSDFAATSFFCERHPSSVFNKAHMVAIKTPDGRKTVDGDTFKIFSGDTLTQIEEGMSEARRAEVLAREFGLA